MSDRPPMTPGAYLKAQRIAAGLTIADVAARLATEPKMAEHGRAAWLALIEAGQVPAAFATIAVLRSVYAFDLATLAMLELTAIGAEEPHLVMSDPAAAVVDHIHALAAGRAPAIVGTDLARAER